MKILFVGNLARSSKGLQLANALSALGNDVTRVHAVPLCENTGEELRSGWSRRLASKLRYPFDSTGLNARIKRHMRDDVFDLLFVAKVLELHPDTLVYAGQIAPECRRVWYSEDDMFARHNQSEFFLSGLSHYDVAVTMKSYNCDAAELPALGARKVIFLDQCFDPNVHRPMPVDDAFRTRIGGPVGFIGTFEEERAVSMLRIAEAGIAVRVWGNSWPLRWHERHRNLCVEGRALYGEDYPTSISCTDINLGFLRKANRDQQTGRSIEIPACGGFMLAERTDEHRRLFEEGSEAMYFADDDELVEKVKWGLANPDARRAIASRGRQRAIDGGYDYPSRVGDLLARICG